MASSSSSSPLHASFPESRSPSQRQHDSQHPPLSPIKSASPRGSASGLRQNRRLQLRNAGFRGATLPPRKVTPTQTTSSVSTSTDWSQASLLQQSSDAENVSPSGRRAGDGEVVSRKPSGGILQDIGNAHANVRTPSGTIRQTKRARPRVTSPKHWSALPSDEGRLDDGNSRTPIDAAAAISSPALQPSVPRPRSTRIRAKMAAAKNRRSLSGEMRQYVDHLEEQLSEAQSQLQAINSPTVTREQASRMRHLNAETRHLQEELTAWEERYEERVQQEMDKHFQLENTLRARVRTLESEADEAKFRIEDMEAQLESSGQTLEAVEAANVNLEKRLEIMSELLAASPTKIDLHAQGAGRIRHARPKSMLPRFPTASSLAASPERQSHTQPTSPSPWHTRRSPGPPISPTALNFSPEVTSSDDEDGVRSDASFGTSIVHSPTRVKSKPTRRMRRFGAGSIGPKPLILPSTSHCEHIPASAPPLDLRPDEPAFSFPGNAECHEDGSPRSSRRRASSEANLSLLITRRSASPVLSIEASHEDTALLESVLGCQPPPSAVSEATTRNFDSLGSALGNSVGRNLMEELTAVKTCSDYGKEDSSEEQHAIPGDEDAAELISSPFNSDLEDDPPRSLRLFDKGVVPDPQHEAPESRFISGSSTAVAPSTAIGTLRAVEAPKLFRYPSMRSLSAHSLSSVSTFESLRSIFSDLFRSPVELAKHLIQTAQSRTRIPRPLLSVQWWLVGVLLGPMARKRMLGHSFPCCDESEQSRLLKDPPLVNETDNVLAYGTTYPSPGSQSDERSPITRARSLVAGKGKKRTSSAKDAMSVSSSSHSEGCSHRVRHCKHSPLLWLKFSMTLAIAVGVAFKDGPSSLLTEALCACHKQSKCANWRRTRRDQMVTPEHV